LYKGNNYLINHIWNSDETRIQGGEKIGASMLTKCGSQQVYITIPISKEWFTMNYAINAAKIFLPTFYIFKSERQ
jgi:hypothetical protein